jgi:C4-type Zn-finger protein
MRITGTPYEEQEREQTQIYQDLHFISCPVCSQTVHDECVDLVDYYCQMPPRQSEFVVKWECTSCGLQFKTYHTLDGEGIIIIPDPKVWRDDYD